MEYLMSDEDPGCIFCEKPAENDDRKNLILLRTPLSFIMLNAYPYNNGHLMVAPFRHVARLADVSPEERCDLMDTVARGEAILGRALAPQGLNVGINLGHCAGAGIPGHVHVHMVPRWEGDTNFMPVVGETRVIPELLLGTYDRLRRHVAEE
jgi:ATP adenylyltransferase